MHSLLLSSQSDRDTLQEFGATFDLNDHLQTQLPPEKLQSGSGLGIASTVNCIYCCYISLMMIFFLP